MTFDFTLTDHSEEVKAALTLQAKAALEAVGNQAVSYAKQNIAKAGRIATGNLQNSISHLVMDDTVYVGTNVYYAIYNEFGTGIYAEGGKGRKTPWRYVDEAGVGHTTHGMVGIHFLKNAVANHLNTFKDIIKQQLKK